MHVVWAIIDRMCIGLLQYSLGEYHFVVASYHPTDVIKSNFMNT